MLHWIVDRWLEDVPRTKLEDIDVETLRKDCLVVAETTYVLAVREQYATDGGRPVTLDRLYGRGGAYRAWNDEGLDAKISPRSEHQILTGQYGSGHLGRYDAPLREFEILRDVASSGDGTRVRLNGPLDEACAGDSWMRAVEDALGEWFDTLLEDEAPTFRFGDLEESSRRNLTRLRDYESLVPLADTLCGPDGFEVETAPGKPAHTPQGLLWRQLGEGHSGTDTIYRHAIQAAEDGSDSQRRLKQVRTLEAFLARVEAQFDLHWQSNVTDEVAKHAYQSLQDTNADGSDLLDGVEAFLRAENRTTGAHRLKRLREALSTNTRRDFRNWLIADFHKSMRVEESNNNAWLALDDGDIRVMTSGYAPGNPFSNGTVERWRKRDYYLGTLKTFYEEIHEARSLNDATEGDNR